MLKKAIIALIVLMGVIGLSYYNATNININQIKVRKEILKSDKIDKDTDGLLLAYFTDLNYGKFIDNGFVDKTVELINVFKPDLIVFGGDLFDNDAFNDISEESISYLTQALSSLNAKYGKYAVLGEADLLYKDTVMNILSQSDFTVLENTHQLISIDRNSSINLIGTEPYIGGTIDYESAFSTAIADTYTILVSHCPDSFDDAINYNFDYMLSGHSRGGQIYLPIISFFTRDEGCKKYFAGKITKNNKTLDISNGLGRLHSNARLSADAEVVFYTLNKPFELTESIQENK